MMKRPRSDCSVVYLCGAIENAPDSGLGWRTRVADKLTTLGHTVIDPTFHANREMAKRLGWVRFDPKRWRDLPHEDWDAWHAECKEIVRVDLDGVTKCNILLVRWDEYIGCGSSGEITLAKFLNRRVYLWLADGMTKENLPVWISGAITDIFESEAEMLRHFKRLQGGY